MTEIKDNSDRHELEWHADSVPVSTRFDDPYYSKNNGRAETDHVFIEGNNLIDRWPEMERCTIAELGFGTGLNFLQTWKRFVQFAPSNSELTFVSFEQFPIAPEDMLTALSAWPELATETQLLADAWKPGSEILEVSFADRINLNVFMSDANTRLPQLDISADVWFLDGFSPAKNPELWNESLLKAVFEKTKAGGTFATYTAAGWVRENLANAGFEVTKTRGFAHKRDMTIGQKPVS